MKLLNKLERKFGKYAIHNLPAIIIALYAAGYLILLFQPGLLAYCTLEPYFILHGQVWRCVTWILMPPSSPDIFTIIMLYFYYSIGKVLEQTWGAFRFNVYILSGIISTVVGAFILYVILGGNITGFGSMFSTYYINLSIFLAFALMYPDMQVMLYFLIPVKMKWMGLIYGIFIIYDFINTNWAGRVAIIASLFNFLLFFLGTRNMKRYRPREVHRRVEFKKAVRHSQPSGNGPRHRCAVCGRTELDNPDLEFRYCSKCSGNFEYCQDHLFTHEHRRN